MERETEHVRMLDAGRLQLSYTSPLDTDCFASVPSDKFAVVAHGNQHGLTFVSSASGFMMATQQQYADGCDDFVERKRVALDHGQNASHVDVRALEAQKQVTLPAIAYHLSLSPDELHLTVAYNDCLALYEVAAICEMTSPSPHHTINNIMVEEIAWSPIANPTGDYRFAVLTHAKKVLLCSTDGERQDVSAVSSAASVAWSPSGESIAIGTDRGSVDIVSVTSLEKERSIDRPSCCDDGYQAHHVNWAEEDVFLVGYRLFDVDRDETSAMACLFEGGECIELNELVAFFDVEGRKHQFYSVFLADWRMFFIACSLSADVELLVADPDTAEWELWKPSEKYQARLPMTANDDETYPLGLTLNLNTQTDVQVDENVYPPPAVVTLATTDGRLVNFSFIDMTVQEVLPFVRAPEPFVAVAARTKKSERTPVSPAVAAAPKPVARTTTSDVENVMAEDSDDDSDLEEEMEEERQKAITAFEEIDAASSGVIDKSRFGDLLEAIGTTYCEANHAKFANRLADSAGVITKDDFVVWYVNWIFNEPESDDEDEDQAAAGATQTAATTANALAKFAMKEGSWRCESCMVHNADPDASKCISCETPNPCFKGKLQPMAFGSSQPAATTSNFKFGLSSGTTVTSGAPSTGFSFGVQPTSDEKTTAVSGFSFGVTSSVAVSTQPAMNISGGFRFGDTVVSTGTETKTAAAAPAKAEVVVEEKKKQDTGYGKNDENEFAESDGEDSDEEEERKEEEEKVRKAYGKVAPGEDSIPVEKFPALFKALGATYCEDEHAKTRELLQKDGMIYLDDFIKWYLDWLFGDGESDEEDEEQPTVAKPEQKQMKSKEEIAAAFSKFAPKEGAWKCDVCMITNSDRDAAKCSSCETPNPAAPKTATATAKQTATTVAGSIGASGFTFPAASKSSTASTGFNFGVSSPATVTTDEAPVSGGFSFGGGNMAGLSFGKATTNALATGGGLTFTTTPQAPVVTKSADSSAYPPHTTKRPPPPPAPGAYPPSTASKPPPPPAPGAYPPSTASKPAPPPAPGAYPPSTASKPAPPPFSTAASSGYPPSTASKPAPPPFSAPASSGYPPSTASKPAPPPFSAPASSGYPPSTASKPAPPPFSVPASSGYPPSTASKPAPPPFKAGAPTATTAAPAPSGSAFSFGGSFANNLFGGSATTTGFGDAATTKPGGFSFASSAPATAASIKSPPSIAKSSPFGTVPTGSAFSLGGTQPSGGFGSSGGFGANAGSAFGKPAAPASEPVKPAPVTVTSGKRTSSSTTSAPTSGFAPQRPALGAPAMPAPPVVSRPGETIGSITLPNETPFVDTVNPSRGTASSVLEAQLWKLIIDFDRAFRRVNHSTQTLWSSDTKFQMQFRDQVKELQNKVAAVCNEVDALDQSRDQIEKDVLFVIGSDGDVHEQLEYGREILASFKNEKLKRLLEEQPLDQRSEDTRKMVQDKLAAVEAACDDLDKHIASTSNFAAASALGSNGIGGASAATTTAHLFRALKQTYDSSKLQYNRVSELAQQLEVLSVVGGRKSHPHGLGGIAAPARSVVKTKDDMAELITLADERCRNVRRSFLALCNNTVSPRDVFSTPRRKAPVASPPSPMDKAFSRLMPRTQVTVASPVSAAKSSKTSISFKGTPVKSGSKLFALAEDKAAPKEAKTFISAPQRKESKPPMRLAPQRPSIPTFNGGEEESDGDEEDDGRSKNDRPAKKTLSFGDSPARTGEKRSSGESTAKKTLSFGKSDETGGGSIFAPKAKQSVSFQLPEKTTNAPASAGSSYKERLVTFYQEFNPSKVSHADQTLVDFKGKEELMFKRLFAKYVAGSTEDDVKKFLQGGAVPKQQATKVVAPTVSTTASLFGKPSGNAFSSPAGPAPSASPFGKPSASASPFGQNAFKLGGATTASPKPSPFGQPAPTASPFGQPTPFGGNAPSNPHRQRLVEFYQKHNPSKLGDVDSTLEKYKGNEEKLFHNLAIKYKVNDGAAAATGGGAGGFGAFPPKSPAASPFGNAGAFGSISLGGRQQQTASAFGAPSSIGFGGNAPTGTGASPFVTAPPAANAFRSVSFDQQQQQQPQSAFGSTTALGAGGSSPFGNSPFGGGQVNHREKLVQFYQKFNPEKLNTVDATLEKYKGNEAKLFQMLEQKYLHTAVPATTATGGGAFGGAFGGGGASPAGAFGGGGAFGAPSALGSASGPPAFGAASALGGASAAPAFGSSSTLGGGNIGGFSARFGATAAPSASPGGAPVAGGFGAFSAQPASFGSFGGAGGNTGGGFGTSTGGFGSGGGFGNTNAGGNAGGAFGMR